MESIGQALLLHGLPGLIILILIYTVIALYKSNQELHEKRVSDQQRFADTLRAAMMESTKTADELAHRFNDLQRSVEVSTARGRK